IGGLSAAISSKYILSTFFDFLESDIKMFRIVGSDVEAYIDPNLVFGFVSPAFVNKTNLTHFRSYGQLRSLYANNFQNCPSLEEVDIVSDFITWSGSNQFRYCSNLSPAKLKLPNISTGTRFGNTFNGLKNDGTTLDLSNVSEINHTGSVSNNTLFGLSTVSVDLRNCHTFNLIFAVDSSFFKGVNSNIKLWSLTSLQQDPSLVTYVFGNSTMTKTIEINIAMKTANFGSPHAELVDAISK